MKVFVVGANGKIGKHLSQKLSNSEEHSIRAMIRTEEQASFFKELGAETVVANLEGTVEEIAEAAKGCDAIVFSAGSGGKTGADKTLLIDLDGAIKTIEAAEKIGIQRFILVSALQANKRENWNDKIRPYYVAKHYADRFLELSDLNYTIIRPGGLLDTDGTGKVSASESLDRKTIPREDVANTIVAALDEEQTYRRSFDLLSGNTLISDALKTV